MSMKPEKREPDFGKWYDLSYFEIDFISDSFYFAALSNT